MHLPLRVKLILVMSVVVAGATIGTAFVSMGVVRKAYEDKFESDFKAEVRYFSQRQLERLDAIKKSCAELAADEAMVTAVQKRDTGMITAAVMHQLRELYETQSPPPTAARGLPGRPSAANGKAGKGAPPDAAQRLAAAAGGGVLNGKFGRAIFAGADRPSIAILDSDGDAISGIGPDGKGLTKEEARLMFSRRGNEGAPEKSVRDDYKLKLKRMASSAGDEQEVAYMTGRGLDGRDVLRSSIVTPVLDKEKGAVVGAVILNVLTSDLGERELHTFSQETDNESGRSNGKEEGISSGFWLEGKLHTRTIPESARQAVNELVSARVTSAKSSAKFHEATLQLPINGDEVPHKLIFRVLNPDSPFPPACQVALYSLKDEIAEEHALQKKISTIGLLALAIALVCVLLISRNFTRPIGDLVASAEQIRQGNYDVSVSSGRRDELGQLAVSFNEMAEGLRMNQKYQRLLSQVADRMVAEQLINNEAALGGELREVSVLFCDIRGFTKITAGMPPHEIIAMLNEHMTALTELVHRHHGVVDKFVGDMVMALFGAPSAYGDDAKRAALCALRMVQVREELNASGNWQMQVGIGIATGTVVAGCMGSEERLDYTVLGEKVNLASRLCGLAEPGEVLIDDTTREKLGSLALVQTLPALEIRGFDEMITAYRLCTVSHDDATEQAFDASALVQAQT